jgi:hypothetical protein
VLTSNAPLPIPALVGYLLESIQLKHLVCVVAWGSAILRGRTEQPEGFSAVGVKEFEEWMLVHLKKFFPNECLAAGAASSEIVNISSPLSASASDCLSGPKLWIVVFTASSNDEISFRCRTVRVSLGIFPF